MYFEFLLPSIFNYSCVDSFVGLTRNLPEAGPQRLELQFSSRHPEKNTVTGNQHPWGGGLLAGCLLIGIILQQIIVCDTHTDWTHNIFPSCKWSVTVLMSMKLGV